MSQSTTIVAGGQFVHMTIRPIRQFAPNAKKNCNSSQAVGHAILKRQQFVTNYSIDQVINKLLNNEIKKLNT